MTTENSIPTSGIQLPSGLVADGLQEMTGADQEILCDKRMMKNGRGINVVASRRIETIDGKPVTEEVFKHLLSGDRAFLLMELRKHSLGTNFEFTHTCGNKNCAKDSEYSMNLDAPELAPRSYPHENTREFDFTLPKSGTKVFFKLLDGVGEEWISTQSSITPITALEARKPQYEKEGHRLPLNTTNLGLQDLTALRQYIKSLEGGIDPVATFECPHCGMMNKVNLVQNASFFFPAAT